VEVSALAAELLAVRPVVALGMVGAGVQARPQCVALCRVLRPDVLHVYDISEAAKQSFVAQMAARGIGCRVEPESDVKTSLARPT
jgi:ornithine cyclodeaminase/alanine dehydrogenase-like protein (mu-crystallin family)